MANSIRGPPRLLMPTVRPPAPLCIPQCPPSPPTRRQTSSKLIRSRSGSATAIMTSAAFNTGTGVSEDSVGERWIGRESRLEIAENRVELQGYQMYAVEKWIVERVRPVTVLIVYTGDPSHKVTVTVLKPADRLTHEEGELEFKLSVQHLRKDGARPKQTPMGILMVTSLANFRSDYTIVQIPDGDFLAVQERLYCNINLLRMGCSGRSAVTLEEPGETTKDRFKSLYLIPDTPSATHPFRSKSPPNSRVQTRTFSHSPSPLILPDTLNSSSSHVQPLYTGASPQHSTSNINAQQSQRHPHFAATVLELVKLMQAALSVCGMFPLTSLPMLDGLLCDVTIDGLQKWMVEVGESLPGIEATERIADPSAVGALLSFVLSARNKLASFAQAVPKDPFLHPHVLIACISACAQAQLLGISSHLNNGMHSSPTLSHTETPLLITVSGASSPGLSVSPAVSICSPSPSVGASSSVPQPALPTYLNLHLYNALTSTHEARLKHSDSRRVQRIILSTLDPASEPNSSDDERRGLSGRVRGFVGRGGVAGAEGVLVPVADLGTFVRAVIGRDKQHEKVGSRAEKNKLERERVRKDEKPDEVDEKERVAGSVRALWTGRVEVAVRLRARAVGPTQTFHRTREKVREKDKERLTSSDVDDLGIVKSPGEDDNDLTFGGAWSGKVQKKLEFWAGINRSKRSIDLSSPLRSAGRSSLIAVPLSAQSSLSGHVYADTSVLPVPSVVLSPNSGDDEDLPSSGQVSPISISKTHNPFILDPSDASITAQRSTSNLNKDDPEYNRRVKSFLARHPRRPRDESRVSSWSGVGNAEEKRKSVDKSTERESEAESKRKMLSPDIRRRHSFHDLDAFRDLRILPFKWMRIDVDLCSHLLVMHRREEHLKCMLACLEHVSSNLAATNAALLNDDRDHREFLSNLSSQLEALQRVEDARVAAHSSRQQVAALDYEAGQFRRQDLWNAAIAPRAKVLELRGKVFGSDTVSSRKRRRKQWTLGGQEREVDVWGRTESEAEEERRAGAGLGDLRVLGDETDDEMSQAEEDDEHKDALMQPMWLLKFLTRWTASLGFLAGQSGVQASPSQSHAQSRDSSVPATDSRTSGSSISPSLPS
ncbi:uncharacterized protein HD556DRAFT_1324065 [Suillus plorans]|uniref:STB6-like N-terminal domain-containing protein n=1 Tax=Suillus plorans TaxID=116603 RepID=A0A9P7DZ83_9AGAM|nr:uncharacterized protein HD556DRAFT_1324065 [Suillus plorans]KAG1806788.1 hypothetical protein HD556DRAFT_1324065 [Suillus plorans]